MSLRYGALYLPATESTTKETTASLTVDLATTATAGASDKSTTASLTVAPATEASGVRVVDTTAAVNVTPATAAEGERVAGTVTHETTASLDATPVTAATAVREQSTTASLDLTPTTSATVTRTADTDASLTVAPATAAEATAWRLTVNDGTAATDVSGTWSTESSAWDDNALTYATATGVGTHVLDITGYDFGTVVGSSDELVSVTVNVSGYCSDAARFAAPTVQAFDGSTGIGSPIALLERTSAGNEDVTISGITLAQIRSADFKIRYSVEQTS